MSNLQDRINDEINNIVLNPDPLTPEQRKHLKTLKGQERYDFIDKCIQQAKDEGRK